MRHPRTLTALGAALVLTLAACGDPGSADGGSAATATPADGGTSAAAACEPMAGEQLVVLEDDQDLQTVDNVIPAVHASDAEPAMIAALDAVSASLDTEALRSGGRRRRE